MLLRMLAIGAAPRSLLPERFTEHSAFDNDNNNNNDNNDNPTTTTTTNNNNNENNNNNNHTNNDHSCLMTREETQPGASARPYAHLASEAAEGREGSEASPNTIVL